MSQHSRNEECLFSRMRQQLPEEDAVVCRARWLCLTYGGVNLLPNQNEASLLQKLYQLQKEHFRVATSLIRDASLRPHQPGNQIILQVGKTTAIDVSL